jgi:RND family efflux transporter MFP subunit
MRNHNTVQDASSRPAALLLLLCGLLLCAAAVWATWCAARERQDTPPVSITRPAEPAKTDAQAAAEPAQPQGAASQAGAAAAESFSEVRALLAAAKETVLASRIQGTITNIAVTHGASFAKDKVLVSFDHGEQSARLAMAEAELAAARETHQAKLRMQGLQQASEVEVALAASAVSKAQAQTDLYRAQIKQCSIKAPFRGRVVKLEAKPFQTVQPGQPLLEIVAAGPLVVRLNAPAAWLQWVKPGTPFWFRIDGTDKRYQAEVSALNGRVDAVSQTVEIEGALLAETPELLPGMSGIALFTQPAR